MKNPKQSLLLRLTTENSIHRLLAHLNQFSTAKTEMLGSKQILIRHRATEEAYIIRLQRAMRTSKRVSMSRGNEELTHKAMGQS